MKPKRPHPLYHFDPEFKPRPKLVEARRFNWPLVVGILFGIAIAIALTLGSFALAAYLTRGVCR